MNKFFIGIVLFLSLSLACSSSSKKEEKKELDPLRVRLVFKKSPFKKGDVVNEKDFIVDIKVNKVMRKKVKNITVDLNLDKVINNKMTPTIINLINKENGPIADSQIIKKKLAKKGKLADLTIQ